MKLDVHGSASLACVSDIRQHCQIFSILAGTIVIYQLQRCVDLKRRRRTSNGSTVDVHDLETVLDDPVKLNVRIEYPSVLVTGIHSLLARLVGKKGAKNSLS